MILVFNPINTKIEKDFLRVCIDFFPERGDKSYNVDNPNPIISHFVSVDDDINQKRLEEVLNTIVPPNVIATVDEIMSDEPRKAIHRISPLMVTRSSITKSKTKLLSAQDISHQLNGFALYGTTGKAFIVEPRSLDIGPGTSFTGSGYGTYTQVCQENPANITLPIDTIQVNVRTNIGTFYIGTWYSTGVFVNRDYTTFSSLTVGLHTLTGQNITCQAGDYLGCYNASGGTYGGNNGYSTWMRGGNYFGSSFSVQYTVALSDAIYGTGTEPPPSLAIADVDGVPIDSVAAVDGILKASIRHINGIG